MHGDRPLDALFLFFDVHFRTSTPDLFLHHRQALLRCLFLGLFSASLILGFECSLGGVSFVVRATVNIQP